ncbi:MAG TPA: GYD domain-containing protein [Acidimicrobiales bacterium]|nr:GYD domain-containing protein [Acidimicrobiales bacterium]
MSYLTATKLTFAPKWADMSDDERLAEQVAAYEIVAKCGGELKAQYVLWSDNCLLSIAEYPDEVSAMKSESAIGRRGAFLLQAQRAVPLEDVLSWQDEVRTIAGR